MPPVTSVIKLTANFDRNLAEVEAFFDCCPAATSIRRAAGRLMNSVIPNLERFPSLGRLFWSGLCGQISGSRQRHAHIQGTFN